MALRIRQLALSWITAAVLSLTVACVSGDETRRFRESLPHSKVAVYPAVVRTPNGVSHDAAAAEAVAKALGGAGAKDVLIMDRNLQLSKKSSFNQASMFKASLEEFGRQVKANPPQADYAAVVEMLAGGNGAIGGIHLYVVRADGSRAFGCLLNSHYKEFKRVWPKSSGDATGVLLTWLRDELPRE